MNTEFNMILPLTEADNFLFKNPNSIIPLYFINQYMYECVTALENSNNDTQVLSYPSIVENMLSNVYTWLYDGLNNDEEEDVEIEKERQPMSPPELIL